MSTRSNIVVTDGNTFLIFYKHSDGYPKGTLPLLRSFVDDIAAGKIRSDVTQSAGWLIRNTILTAEESKYGYGWKASHIEPASLDCLPFDTEYLYVVNTVTKRIEYSEVNGTTKKDIQKLMIKSCQDPDYSS